MREPLRERRARAAQEAQGRPGADRFAELTEAGAGGGHVLRPSTLTIVTIALGAVAANIAVAFAVTWGVEVPMVSFVAFALLGIAIAGGAAGWRLSILPAAAAAAAGLWSAASYAAEQPASGVTTLIGVDDAEGRVAAAASPHAAAVILALAVVVGCRCIPGRVRGHIADTLTVLGIVFWTEMIVAFAFDDVFSLEDINLPTGPTLAIMGFLIAATATWSMRDGALQALVRAGAPARTLRLLLLLGAAALAAITAVQGALVSSVEAERLVAITAAMMALGIVVVAITVYRWSISVQAQLVKNIATDPLTGAWVGDAFRLISTRKIAARFRSETALTLIAIDVNGLKPVNDRFGHAAGDELLERVGQSLSQQAREGDIVGRLGGDEFAVLVAGPIEAAAEYLLRTRRAIYEKTAIAAPPWGEAHFSAGMCEIDDSIEDLDAALRIADERMYEDKIARKHRG